MHQRLLLLVWLSLSAAATADVPSECGPCDEEQCEPPKGCLSGMVRDKCQCCFVCGGREGERCDHPDAAGHMYSYGGCGEGLKCQLRTDLAPGDKPEALCACIKDEVLCGSDGETYVNDCQLTEARYRRRDSGLRAVSRGPCKSAPTILSPPDDVANYTGTNVALSCEATGWPIPTIEWQVDHGEGEPSPLPSDDSHIAVQSRGGPSHYEITSWVQLINLIPTDDATYWCVARNEQGEARAAATITVLGVDVPGFFDGEEEESINEL